MRMNPAHGQTASGLIIAAALAGREIDTTSQLASAIRAALPMRNEEERDESGASRIPGIADRNQ
jgi:hypothetical protein